MTPNNYFTAHLLPVKGTVWTHSTFFRSVGVRRYFSLLHSLVMTPVWAMRVSGDFFSAEATYCIRSESASV